MNDTDFIKRTLALFGIDLPAERAEVMTGPGGLFTHLSVVRLDILSRDVASYQPAPDVTFDDEG